MLLKRISKTKISKYFWCVFGGYIAALLWITLFSRLGDNVRRVCYPFQSYIMIFRGSWRALIENIENVILFLPIGFALGSLKKPGLKRIALYCFLCSLGIECIQRCFALGTFEPDDLLNNTIGGILGCKFSEKVNVEIEIKKDSVKVTILSAILFLAIPFGYVAIRYHHMIQLAALYDGEDGTRNLMILKGEKERFSGTELEIGYLENGSILVSGTTNKDVWPVISDVVLQPGEYIVAELGETSCDGVSMRLGVYDKSLKDYKKFTEDVGCSQNSTFTITETVKLRVFLRCSSQFPGTCIITPVIYKVA